MHDLILCTLKFTNVCPDICCKTLGSCGIVQYSVKGLIKCVQQKAFQYCGTYGFYNLIMGACISWNICKIRDSNKGSGDSKENAEISSLLPGYLVLCTAAVKVSG